jgi:hypothetical protein
MTRRFRCLSSRLNFFFSFLSLIAFAAPSMGQSPRGTVPNTAAHDGSISATHSGRVQIFTTPSQNFGSGFVNQGYPKCCINGFLPNNPAQGSGFRAPIRLNRGHHRNFFNGGYGTPVYAVPYYYPPDFVNGVDDTMEETYAPGPTIFDRASSTRSSIDYERSYDERLRRIERQMEETDERSAPPRAAPVASDDQPAPDQQPTVLVFRNGHTEEVKNYAIVGDTLFDFSGDHRRRVSLYDLDLPATQRKNDERGVDFRLPVSAASN